MTTAPMPTRSDVERLVGARCYADDVEPELFFVVGHGAATDAQVEAAQDVCRPCPVQEACLAQAEARGEKFGVWGGKNFDNGCGTYAGFARHRRLKQRPCARCNDAKNAYKRDLRAKASA